MNAALEDDLGLELDRFIEELRSRTPTPEETRILQLRPGEIVMQRTVSTTTPPTHNRVRIDGASSAMKL